jgi:hypothetical protein
MGHFQKTPHGRMFWQDVFEASGYLNAEREKTYDTLFVLLNPLEEAAWRLMDIVEAGLTSRGWRQESGDAAIDGNRAGALKGAVELYNAAIERTRTLGMEVGRLHFFETDESVELSAFSKCCRERFVELKSAFEIRFPLYDEGSETPFSPSAFTKSRDFEDEYMSGVYILMFDLVNSKGASIDVKVHVREALERLDCLHERTGNDAFLVIAKSAEDAVSILQTVRDRTLQFIGAGETEYRGVRASITRGDCIIRHVGEHDPRLITITDRPGTPDIPNTAYQMDEIKTLLGSHDKLGIEDQTKGVAVDREVALEVAGTDDRAKMEDCGIYELGRWKHKQISGDAYFWIRRTERHS